MKLSKILIGAILALSVVNANWESDIKNIKSSSEIYKKNIDRLSE